VDVRCRIGDTITAGAPLFDVHARSPGELGYALDYANAHRDIVAWQEDP
jgi:thymidine phosphorylase